MRFLNFLRPKTGNMPPLLERCLSVNLEVNPKTAEIFDLAAVRHGTGPAVVAAKGWLPQSLNRLEAALETTSHMIGHNILRHDIEHLLAARPRLREKMAAPIDTLWLNPLLLLTAHRSKGLEFDHVVILNGGWQAISQGEDGEAPRRLFYVAMTRARRSLAVVTSGTHAFVRADSDSELLRKVEAPRPLDLPDPDQYQLPDMGLVDLSFAGRLPEQPPAVAYFNPTQTDQQAQPTA